MVVAVEEELEDVFCPEEEEEEEEPDPDGDEDEAQPKKRRSEML